VVSPLDPPLARVTGEVEAVPVAPPVPRPSPPPARPRTAYPPPAGPPVALPPPPMPKHLEVGVVTHTEAGGTRRRPPVRTTGSRWLDGGAALVGLIMALGFAWFVLVMVRQPGALGAPADQIGAHIDDTLIETLLADRVQSVLGWVTNVTTTLVLGGAVFRLFVVGQRAGRSRRRGWGRGARGRSTRTAATGPAPAATPGAGSEYASSAAMRTLRRAAVVGMVAELASVFVRAVAVSGDGLAAAWDPRMIRFVLDVRFGDAALIRVAGLAILAGLSLPIETRRRWSGRLARLNANASNANAGNPDAGNESADRLRLERLFFLVGAGVVLASFALVGHPQATGPRPLLPLVQCAHVLAVSTWFGGVTFLAIELRQQRREGTARVSAEFVARFSTLATIIVPLAVATGVVLANSQLDELGALVDTAYGRALLVKLSALSVPLAIGGYNRQWLVPAVAERDEPAAWRHLRQTLVVEVLFIALGVLLATAAMTSGGF
jgi:putative copper export protein